MHISDHRCPVRRAAEWSELMGLRHAKSAAEVFVDELYERMLGVGHQLVARDELPRDAEEFAQAVVHVVFDALAAGLRMVNEDQLAPR